MMVDEFRYRGIELVVNGSEEVSVIDDRNKGKPSKGVMHRHPEIEPKIEDAETIL